jgi:hypothetical protein
MAAKQGLFRARKNFWAGSVGVRVGDLIVAGHPLLDQHPDAFEPVVVRFPVDREPKAAVRAETGTRRGEHR